MTREGHRPVSGAIQNLKAITFFIEKCVVLVPGVGLEPTLPLPEKGF
jgi:hypothetical protein